MFAIIEIICVKLTVFKYIKDINIALIVKYFLLKVFWLTHSVI